MPQPAEKPRVVSEALKIIWRNAIGIKMHDIISNASDFIEPFTKCGSINSYSKLSPTIGILQ